MVSKTIARATATAGLFLVASAAFAQTDEAQLRQSLEIAAKFAREKKLKQVPVARLAPGSIDLLKLNGKFYHLKDHWTVKFTPNQEVAAMARMAAPDGGEVREGEPSFYEFTVLEVTDEGLARIEVRPRKDREAWSADRNFDHLVLVMNKRFIPLRKEIYHKGNAQPARVLRFDSGETMASGFEASPLDLPNLGTDDGKPVRDSAGRVALAFDVQDLFGRPVSVLWRQGEMWPAEVRSTAGLATVVER